MDRQPSLREKLNDAAGWIIAGCALVAIVVITAALTSIDDAIGAGLLFIGLMAGGFLSIAAHELGHAVAARLAGWRVWIISVLGIVVRSGHTLRFSARHTQDAGGYVLGSPPEAALDSKWRSIVFSAGGPLVSLVTTLIIAAMVFAIPRSTWQAPISAGFFAAILAFGVASAVSAALTLWPSRGKNGRPNDMTMILDALSQRDPSIDVRGVAWARALFEHGIEPAEWPQWMHDAITRTAANPWSSPAAPLLAFLRAIDVDDEASARGAAQINAHGASKLMRAYIHAYFDKDLRSAESALDGIAIGANDDALVLLHRFVHARMAALSNDAQRATRLFGTIAKDLESGVPKPFWDRLLARAI